MIDSDAAYEVGHAQAYELTYASLAGGRVPALLVLPERDGPFPGVILQHGLPGARTDLLDAAFELAQADVGSLLIDAPFARSERLGPGKDPINFTGQDRDEQIQLIVDLRRAVDLLRARPDFDSDRIGFIGVSYGAAMGGLLAGVEDRIAAYALVVGDGGLVSHLTGPESGHSPLDDLDVATRDTWLAAMEPIEPIHYVGRAKSPVLFQSGTLDEAVPASDADQYHGAGNRLSRALWYNAGHSLNETARCDTATWLGKLLAFDGSASGMC